MVRITLSGPVIIQPQFCIWDTYYYSPITWITSAILQCSALDLTLRSDAGVELIFYFVIEYSHHHFYIPIIIFATNELPHSILGNTIPSLHHH